MSAGQFDRAVHTRPAPLVGLLALLCATSSAAAAQRDARGAAPVAVRERPGGRVASQVVRTGGPARRLTWAWRTLPSCGGEGGAATATALRALRVSTDTAALHRLEALAFSFRDGALFAAALGVAGDTAATPAARGGT